MFTRRNQPIQVGHEGGQDHDPEFHYRFGIGLFIDGVKAAAARM